MGEVVVRAEHLSKRYCIRQREGYYTLRDTISKRFRMSFRLFKDPKSNDQIAEPDYIWSLNDISFEVNRGEVVGIIGRNGAGKSTLLKILSRITEPTKGCAEIHGRVGSLLEVGTGFHPELTGRENIYLNGAILGMRKSEIVRKFDEIVAFAEVEKFIDTAVKHYSSGMYVRLAFAVAAHLEPEILLVDEVLAVGDAAFQKKCLGRMSDVAKEGRTIFLVSHNLGAVNNFCERALLLDIGKLIHTGPSGEIVTKYLNMIVEGLNGEVFFENIQADAFFTRIAVLDRSGCASQILQVSSGFTVLFEYDVQRSIAGLEVSFSLFDKYGSKLFYSGFSKTKTIIDLDHRPGHYVAKANIPALFIAPGVYTITAGLHKPGLCLFDRKENAIGFSVVETGSQDYRYSGQDIGSIIVHFEWSHERVSRKSQA